MYKFIGRVSLWALLMIILAASVVSAAGRLYFATIVEKDDGGNARVMLEWGALEGALPAEIEEFRLYRSENGGDYEHLADLGFDLVPAADIAVMAGEETTARKLELISMLNRMSLNKEPEPGPVVNAGNFHFILHDYLDPAGTDYSPLSELLLTRSLPLAARARGLAWLDLDVTSGKTYRYMLTALSAGGEESKPIGQSNIIDPAVETVLPAPAGFRQVYLADCSDLGKGRDDNKIHFSWDVPVSPDYMGQRIMTFGYDLYWSAVDLGALDLRNAIPAGLNRLGEVPVVAAGPPAAEGPDSFLALDDGSGHASGPAWKRGRTYYYYLVARDIAGHYSDTTGPLAATVVDSLPPKAVWNAHTEELKDEIDSTQPRLSLVWDQQNPLNYIRFYGQNKNICGVSGSLVSYTLGDASCADPANLRYVDLQVDLYRLYRFASASAARTRGADNDGDGWTDTDEINSGNDPCDAADFPAGDVPNLVAVLDQNDSAYQRDISGTGSHIQFQYVDEDIDPDNQVYWYRIAAVDANGNQGPMSPPVRGVLFNRVQPDVDAGLKIKNCIYEIKKQDGDCRQSGKDQDAVVIVNDTSGAAASYSILQRCNYDNYDYGNDLQIGMPSMANPARILFKGDLDQDGRAVVSQVDLKNLYGEQCLPDCSKVSASYLLRFHDGAGKVLAQTEIGLDDCYFSGCYVLSRNCRWLDVTGPGQVPDNDEIQICVDLEAGEMARIYHRVGGEMSPFMTIDPALAGGEVCDNIDGMSALVTGDLCLGIRVFSPAHVGSGMYFFNCLEMMAADEQPPATPLLEAVSSIGTQADPAFELKWAAETEGIGSFILRRQEGSEVYYESLWGLDPDGIGQYSHELELAAEDLNRNWCFAVRAVDTTLTSSGWSAESCGVWELNDTEDLAWPPVAEPTTHNDPTLSAFYLGGGDLGLPVILLSKDLTDLFAQESDSCQETVPDCYVPDYNPEQPVVMSSSCFADQDIIFQNCYVCAMLKNALTLKSYVVYRQDEGRNFVQVSPLIDRFFCELDYNPKRPHEVLDDPFIYLKDIDVSAVSGGVDPADVSGIRLFFLDHYPHQAGGKIRYKVVRMNAETGEPVEVHTTNWVQLP